MLGKEQNYIKSGKHIDFRISKILFRKTDLEFYRNINKLNTDTFHKLQKYLSFNHLQISCLSPLQFANRF